jgi:hypothetical protein
MVALPQFVGRKIDLLRVGMVSHFTGLQINRHFAYLTGHKSRRDKQNWNAPLLVKHIEFGITRAELAPNLREQEAIDARPGLHCIEGRATKSTYGLLASHVYFPSPIRTGLRPDVNDEGTLYTLGSSRVDEWSRVMTMSDQALTFEDNPLPGVLLAMHCEPR